MQSRSEESLHAELERVRWLLDEIPRWDASLVPVAACSGLAELYQQKAHVLERALGAGDEAERVEPAQIIVEPKPPELLVEPLLPIAPPELTLDDQVVEQASLWHEKLKPFLSESIGWFIGGFLILAGTLYWVADAWGSMSGTTRSLTVFAFAAAWTLGLTAWSRFLARREATEGAGRVLALIAAAVAPLPAVALGPMAATAPLLFVPALLGWAAFVFWLGRRVALQRDDVGAPWHASAGALTTALMALAAVVASPWLALLPVAAFLAGARKAPRSKPFALVAPLYLLALVCVRLHVQGGIEPATWAPIASAFVYGALQLRARRADALSIGAVLVQGALLGVSVAGAAPAFFLASLALAATAFSLVSSSPRFVYPAYVGAYFAFQTCGQLVPGPLKDLLAQLRAALGYTAGQQLPPAYGAIYAAVFVVAGGLFAAVKLRGPVQRAVLTATAWASAFVGALGLQSVLEDPRPALWSAPLVMALCLVLGPLCSRRALSWVGAALSLVTAVALGAPLGAGVLALLLAVLSIPQLKGHREAMSAGAGALAALAIAWAFLSPSGGAGIAAIALASAAVLLAARNLGSEELLALAFFAPVFLLPKVALVFAPELVGASLALSAILLSLSPRRGEGRGEGAVERQKKVHGERNLDGARDVDSVAAASSGARLPPHPSPLPYGGRGSSRFAAWAAAAVAPALALGTPWLSLTLLLAAVALLAGRKSGPAHALGIAYALGAFVPLRDVAPFVALAASLGASLYTARYGRSWRTALVASLAIVLALTGGVGQTALAFSAATALLSTLALLPAVSIPLAAALAAGALFFNPLGLVALGACLSLLALLEPRVKGMAWAASLSAVALAPLTLGMAAWKAPGLLLPVCVAVTLGVFAWVRATRWPFFAVLIPAFLLVPQLEGAGALHLWLVVLGVVALTRVSQLGRLPKPWSGGLQNALGAGLALSGVGLGLGGHVSLLPFAAGLLLAAGEPAAWRVAAATVFALAVPGVAPLAAVGFLVIGVAARHSPRAARWVLGDEERGWTVTSAAIASVVCAAFSALSQPSALGPGLLLGGCLACCAVLLGFRWLLSFSVVAFALPIAAALSLRLPEAGNLRAVTAVLVAAAVAALSRAPRFSASTLKRCAHVGRAFDGPLSTPLWLGAAVTLAFTLLTHAAPLPLVLLGAALLLVTGVPWEAGVAVALGAAALVLQLPQELVSTALACVGLVLCGAGVALEKKLAVGRSWHHAGWLLALAALPLCPGLESPLTVCTLAAAAACGWCLALRQRRHEWLAWSGTAIALHLGLFFAGLRLGHGDPQVLILPWCALVSVALGAVAFQLPHRLQRYRFGRVAMALGLAELGGALLLDGAYPREGVVAAAAAVIAVLALGRLALDDDGAAAWLAQVAFAVGFVAFRWVGFHVEQGVTAAFAALVFGAVLGGLARRLPKRSASAARAGAWLWPLLGLLAAPLQQLWVVAALLLAQAVHFAVLSRGEQRRRFAVLSSVTFNAALGVGWLAGGLHHGQYLLVPLGLSALVLLKVFEGSFSAAAVQRCRAVAVTLIYAAAAFEPLAMPTAWALGLCAVVCVLGVAAGIALRVRSYVFLGTGFLVTTVVASMARYGLAQPRVGALLLSGLGLLIVGFMVLVTTRRSELLQRYQRARSMLAQWQG